MPSDKAFCPISASVIAFALGACVTFTDAGICVFLLSPGLFFVPIEFIAITFLIEKKLLMAFFIHIYAFKLLPSADEQYAKVPLRVVLEFLSTDN